MYFVAAVDLIFLFLLQLNLSCQVWGWIFRPSWSLSCHSQDSFCVSDKIHDYRIAPTILQLKHFWLVPNCTILFKYCTGRILGVSQSPGSTLSSSEPWVELSDDIFLTNSFSLKPCHSWSCWVSWSKLIWLKDFLYRIYRNYDWSYPKMWPTLPIQSNSKTFWLILI